MQYRIRLNDGTEFDARFCTVKDESLTMDIVSNLSFIQIAQIMNDVLKTGSITFFYGGTNAVYQGYTSLRVINGDFIEGDYVITLYKVR